MPEMETGIKTLLLVVLSVSGSEIFENGFGRYRPEWNDKNALHHLTKRQTPVTIDYYVTQCGYNNTEPPSGHSINVQGLSLVYPESVEKASRLIHRMVRFMPRPVFTKLAQDSSVGLFPVQVLPSRLFAEFDTMPPNCETNCQGDCTAWCGSQDYPFNPNYPISFMWAYGNFSRTFVVETNIVCFPYNPGQGIGNENLLIREFGITVMTRGIDQSMVQRIQDAFSLAKEKNTWPGLINAYHYFALGTQSWFNGVQNLDLRGMNCIGQTRLDYTEECNDTYQQRQYIKHYDQNLYDILNYIYNNKRDYLEADLNACDW